MKTIPEENVDAEGAVSVALAKTGVSHKEPYTNKRRPKQYVPRITHDAEIAERSLLRDLQKALRRRMFGRGVFDAGTHKPDAREPRRTLG